MKTFKIEGWYRYNDEKDFETKEIFSNNPEDALKTFKDFHKGYNFYKIDIKEIV
jgi:hypothetical protein